MDLIFFDSSDRVHLLPLTFTKPCAELRIGILTIREKWLQHFKGSAYSWFSEAYLQAQYPYHPSEDSLYINGALCPSQLLVEEAASLKKGEALVDGDVLLVARPGSQPFDVSEIIKSGRGRQTASKTHIRISRVWQLFSMNGLAIEQDFHLLTNGRTSARIPESNRLVKPEHIFMEEGASVAHSILNASAGPVYIGKDAEIMEGSMIRGPFALCDHAGVKMGAKIYGPTTIGPYCKAGGEINNSIMMAYSNKGHDGFLGNSVIGEWCNLGADTNNSNLKNNYQEVKIWSYAEQRFTPTGLQFCGLIMGDHSKAGINTMFNTGTVVGVAANIFGAGFPRNFIPSFSWGGAQGFDTFQLPKVYEMAKAMYSRRNMDLEEAEQNILAEVFNQTAGYRFWEKNNKDIQQI